MLQQQNVKLSFLLLISLLGLNTLSCAYLSRDKRPDGSVVERNKESRPAWVDSPTNQLLYTSSETRFHFAILKARDLPIAVKKSQIAAIEASFPLWLPIFDQSIKDVRELKALASSPQTMAELSELKTQFAHRVHTEIAQVEDIYFERVKIDNYKSTPELEGVSEYFDVHTLVHLASIDQEKFARDLGEQLKGSRNKQIRRAGQDFLKRISTKPRKDPKPGRTKGKK
jgi:hypothetical protein